MRAGAPFYLKGYGDGTYRAFRTVVERASDGKDLSFGEPVSGVFGSLEEARISLAVSGYALGRTYWEDRGLGLSRRDILKL